MVSDGPAAEVGVEGKVGETTGSGAAGLTVAGGAGDGEGVGGGVPAGSGGGVGGGGGWGGMAGAVAGAPGSGAGTSARAQAKAEARRNDAAKNSRSIAQADSGPRASGALPLSRRARIGRTPGPL